MAFRVYCDIDDDGTGKKCRREIEPVIDRDTGIVYCECGQKLKDQNRITAFAKTQMISLGQVKRSDNKKKAFSVKCRSCEKESTPSLTKENKLICSICGAELTNLAAPFVQLLKERLRLQKE